MSYSFGMCFKRIKNKKAAYDFALAFTKKCYENADEMLEQEKHYIPTHRKYVFGENAYKFNDVDRFWLYDVFNIRFIYWKKYKLLGIIGDNYPKECMNMIDTSVYFQNSTDQDYDYETWGKKIPLFNLLIWQYKYKNAKQVLKKKNKEYDDYTLEEITKNLDYHRKTLVYSTIYEKLSLEKWLYKKGGNYETFAFNAIEDFEKLMDLSKIVRLKLLEMKKEDEIFLESMKKEKKD